MVMIGRDYAVRDDSVCGASLLTLAAQSPRRFSRKIARPTRRLTSKKDASHYVKSEWKGGEITPQFQGKLSAPTECCCSQYKSITPGSPTVK